ncbi:amidohydrolase family protein [Streptomyces sp. B-S-A8]|uniref:Amidohydrolase family protein n=1 Tax=Streptomyces solicavernae TaxID=3043614 RepID=A0ABT6RTP9_9ACTN|nr:amidohydrolase family protein [Streptomyces sp. B-S-A8]MDI3387808.1 amidohydrolase family protein [Streptomyces sp. B-S-A8]
MHTADRDARTAPADLILRGGVVRSMASGCGGATAIALRSGLVARIGSDAEVMQLAGTATEIVDLAGRAVLPGINDAHLHATWLGAMWPDTLFGEHTAPGPAPERPLLDAGQRRRAILRAGQLASSLGITSYTEPGLGPGEDGGATGAFGTSVAQQYRALAAEGRLRARVTVLRLYGELDGPSDLEHFLSGIAATDSGARHSGATDSGATDSGATHGGATDSGATHGGATDSGATHGGASDPRWLRFAGVKIFADGIPPMKSAYTHRCYADGVSATLLVAGVDDADREANLTRMITAAHHAGQQVGVHATGDRSIDVTLDAIERAQAEKSADLRHYIIHGDLVTGPQLRRMSALGVGLDMQPEIAVRTRSLVDDALGAGSASAAWPLRAALDAEVPLCLTSDAPVLSPDWRRQIAAADEWMGPAADPGRRMARLLHCYTVEPARQDHAASWKGTLAPGMVADLCVLAADPFSLTPAELPDVDVELTILDGKVVYERGVRVTVPESA